MADEAPGVMYRISELYRKGYSPKQIKDKYGYSPRTVGQVDEEFIKPEGLPEGEQRDSRTLLRKAVLVSMGVATVVVTSGRLAAIDKESGRAIRRDTDNVDALDFLASISQCFGPSKWCKPKWQRHPPFARHCYLIRSCEWRGGAPPSTGGLKTILYAYQPVCPYGYRLID